MIAYLLTAGILTNVSEIVFFLDRWQMYEAFYLRFTRFPCNTLLSIYFDFVLSLTQTN